ncbi:MAG: phosphoribosylglycinamide formyltransferase [Nitrososphaerota archaeon]|nr:phosphoribosylglycinamide formyltransferase [Nitrososphaerota archaeon]MDG6967138.1 phosphoribosylglycinamide formyltransferase [Nitrososphaerota archaeon]MDG6978079.1 phosphoribosylglycinamide formyltransferase [Nitrososphaerota archaeon]MDG7005363.1 phosphoribosylglycinamide formyltransferase [Nitrososphaerota archaeon]MDG7020299.1 phosphoribosylglycinamide formyltransferase [Nitrososphaerota archaeon]
MLAILRAVEAGRVGGARVAVVLSDRPGARALKVAERRGVPAVWVDPKGAASREDYDKKLAAALEAAGVSPGKGLVLLAGFMRLLSPWFVKRFGGRLMNVHPSLLPSFPGLDAQRQALEHGVKVAGCTVHFVVPEVDAGPIVAQAAVRVEPTDTEETLAARILAQEHRIYPLAVKLFVEGRLKIEGRRVVIDRR